MQMHVVYIIVVLTALYVLLLRGRSNHPGMKDLRGWAYAHRGLHGHGVPENSMAAFRAALEGGYGIEFDLHLMKDGNLAVIHDTELKRTTGADGRVEDLTLEDLKQYRLEGTEETIPTFRELLDLYGGKAPLIVELKPEDGNHAALAEAACRLLEDYPGVYCLESFDPRCVHWLKKNRPQVIRGQLTDNFMKEKGMPLFLRFSLTNHLLNAWTQPDFIACGFRHRSSIGSGFCRRLWKLQGVVWTIRSREDYDTAVKEGWLPIFEGFKP